MEGKRSTSNVVTILHRRYYENQPERQEDLRSARESLRIAEAIYTLRKAAGLTQKELAQRIGTTPSTISRIESEGYEGHSLHTLGRIAQALGVTLRVEFDPGPSETSDFQPV